MKALLAKLETLADEVIALVREERARRSFQLNPLYGPRGTEIVRPPGSLEYRPQRHELEVRWGGNDVLDTTRVT